MIRSDMTTEQLSNSEREALDAYGEWVNEDCRPRGRLTRLLIVGAVAATLLIAATIALRSLTSADDAKTERSVASAGAGSEGDKLRLVYALPGEVEDGVAETVVETMVARLGALKIKGFSVEADMGGNRITVEVADATADKMALVRRVLSIEGGLLLAIEVTQAELHDPDRGLGPTFDAVTFCARLARVSPRKNAEPATAPDASSLTVEKASPLYRNPDDWTRPAKTGDKPLFHYYPPRERFPSWRKKVDGPVPGAFVHVSPDKSMAADVERAFLSESNGVPVIGFELKPSAKGAFTRMTRDNKRQNLCVIFDRRLVTRPIIMSALPGEGVFEGIDSARDREIAVAVISSGPLKVKPVLMTETISQGAK